MTEAKREGERIVREKALGTLAVSAISAVDRIALEGALAEMAKADGTATATVPRLIEAVRDYATARVALPKGATLAEAAKFFAERHPASMPRKTVAEVVAEFIADRQSAGCSEIHLRDLRIRLAQQFAMAFAVRMGALTAPLVQAYIYGLKNTRTGKPASNRSKENMLRCVVSLANFARRMKYVPAELALELSEIPTPKKQHKPIGIYTPAEITKLLAAADSEIIPALAIAAFADLRMTRSQPFDCLRLRVRRCTKQAGASHGAGRGHGSCSFATASHAKCALKATC